MTVGRSRCWSLAVLLVAALAAQPARAGSSTFCDRNRPLGAEQQDRVLQFAAVARDELGTIDANTVLVSRSGLDLSRFAIRYSHAAIGLSREDGTWFVRQLYYACDEGRPRLFDQGIAGFVSGTDDPDLGYLSIVVLPRDAAAALRLASLDDERALALLASTYSANAYPFSVRYQNCNQWVIELLAVAWGDLRGTVALRSDAQQWLEREHYGPAPVDIGSRAVMLAAHFVPLVHLDDHPDEDRARMKLRISLPAAIEAFVHDRLPAGERIELCHDRTRIVVHRGWDPIADGCEPRDGDRVIPLGPP